MEERKAEEAGFKRERFYSSVS